MSSFSYETLPRKQMAAGALIRDAHGNILIVKPTYRLDWLIPGGSVENEESPLTCVAREVQEELSIVVPIGRLLCIEYHRRSVKRPENLRFIFDGGVLDDDAIRRISLPATELSEYRFVPLDEAMHLLAAKLNRRVELCVQALRDGRFVYIEDGTVKG